MNTTTRKLSNKLSTQMKALIVQVVQEILTDPDFRFDLTAQARKRLQRVSRKRRNTPFSEIKKKYY